MNGAYQNVLKIFKRQRNFYADGETRLYTGLSVHVILYCRYIQPSFFIVVDFIHWHLKSLFQMPLNKLTTKAL